MDAVIASNLKDVLLLKNKPEETLEKNLDKMNQTVCDIIISCLT